jgi:hypothetical protein
MTPSTTTGPHLAGSLHQVLLRMAGRVPDDLVTEARTWLAAGQCADVVQALVFGAAASAVPVEVADADLFAEVLAGAGVGTEILDDVQRGEIEGYPPYAMAPVAPEILDEHGDAVPANLDHTGAYANPWGADPVDEAATAAVAVVAGGVSLVGLWRAWRYPANQSPWPPPKRIYLVEAARDVPAGQLPAVATAIQDALVGVGEYDPQVEVVAAGGTEPVYQAWVRGFGALLWAAASTAPLRVARAFDRVDPTTGPAFDPDHPRLDDADQGAVTEYLNAGTPLLSTTVCLPDLVDPSRGEVVPVNLRTDGRWVWADTTTYYLEHHGLAPDPDLLNHVLEVGSQPPEVDSVGLHLAMVALQNSARDQMWVP